MGMLLHYVCMSAVCMWCIHHVLLSGPQYMKKISVCSAVKRLSHSKVGTATQTNVTIVPRLLEAQRVVLAFQQAQHCIGC